MDDRPNRRKKVAFSNLYGVPKFRNNSIYSRLIVLLVL